jgi:hypothetical protein
VGIPKILFLDVETAPNLSWVWGRWEQNVIDVHTHWYMLSFAWKWQGGKRVSCHALPDYPRYAKDRQDDKSLIEDLHRILDQADVVIAHNGDAFDLRKANSRFLYHGLKPTKPFKTIDTLKISRKFFKNDSNKLDDLGAMLKVGRKLPHTGKHLWLGCMGGKKSSWVMMKKYNIHDVVLLESVYNKLKPWATNHPNLTLYDPNGIGACPTCRSINIVKRGTYYARGLKYHQFTCRDCGHWYHGGRVQ